MSGNHPVEGDQFWSVTAELRWRRTWEYNTAYYALPSMCKERLVLQQRWQGSAGGSRWEDVPVVDGPQSSAGTTDKRDGTR